MIKGNEPSKNINAICADQLGLPKDVLINSNI